MNDEALLVLKQLARKGELTPERVVEHAQRQDSPLHEFFEWDDALAAQAHRLQQARSLIRSVRVEVTVEEHILSVPRYVHDPDRDDTGGYIETLSIKDDRQIAMRVLTQEVARAIGCLQRARKVAAALGMSGVVDGLILQMSNVQVEVEAKKA